ncbi:hypothetical protein MKW94_007347 [Papaver nudicaule]|uniref:Uncharacterized protein n=1 Tax=Papaver nudicaule TaxID=74823 RepID=A0AA42B251_PAPNU|nr:hypothetical protein [Papaver nudicaule]
MVMSHEIQLAETTDLENPSTLIKETVKKKLTLVPLIFLIFYEVSGGPFGAEPAVKAAGPLYAWLGFLIFPLIWSIPEALITAELATAYPGNGGYVIWATEAFGPFWGSMMGSLKFLSGSINNAAYPALIKKYVQTITVFKFLDTNKTAGHIALSTTTILLALLNYFGLSIVGWIAAIIAVVSVAPFIVMIVMAIPKMRWSRLLSLGQNDLRNFSKNNWKDYLNTVFWNLNFWDNASTLAGEVANPQKTFPIALFSAGIIVCLGYLLSLLAAIGAIKLDQTAWETGYFSTAAGMIGGEWLKIWVDIGSGLSGIGLFEAQLSSSSFQTLGMADLGFLPGFFAWRSKYFNTPWVGIVLSSAITLSLTFADFDQIVNAANFLYSLGMLLEFSAFIWLRIKYPDLNRPYKVPASVSVLSILMLIPAGFVVLVLRFSDPLPMYISLGLTFLAICNYFLMNYLKSKGCIKFNNKDNNEQVVEK